MPRQSLNVLCSYRYDPLDRLVAGAPSAQPTIQRFYLKDHLTTEIQGSVHRSIMQHNDQLLALLHQSNEAARPSLLATDQQRSVLTLLDAKRPHAFAYMPYGHSSAGNGLLSLLGFNGERLDPVTRWYLLGNGYRALSPVLMRFNSPDSWSPFGDGGVNAYAYCKGNPINFSDPTGHMRSLKSLLGIKKIKIPARETASVNSGKMRNVTRISDDAYTFESTHKGGLRLTLSAHGDAQSKNLVIGGQQWTADDVIKNVNIEHYDQIRILACFSDEIGAEIALKTGKETKAYIGVVTTNIPDNAMERAFEFHNSTRIPDLTIFSLKIRKTNTYNQKTNPIEYSNFNYQPVRFKP